MKPVVKFTDTPGGLRQALIPSSLWATDPEAVLKMLEANGLSVSPEPGARQLAIQYLTQEFSKLQGESS